MKAIVVGAGQVGESISRYLVQEDHSVVLIDENPDALAPLAEALDIQVITGVGSRPNILRQAGADKADAIIAVTSSDEVNMVACHMAHTLFNIPKKIARVRDRSYAKLTRDLPSAAEKLNIDAIISPEQEIADAILKTLSIPGAFDVAGFANDHLMLIGVHLTKPCSIAGQSLGKIGKIKPLPFTVAAIYRHNRLILPTENDHLEIGDEVFVLTPPADVSETMRLLGLDELPARNIFIAGGGNVAYEVCKRLEKHDVSLRVLEKKRARADVLASKLKGITILHGDALNRDLLVEENIGSMDAMLALTSDDAANILSSILSRQLGAKTVITLLQQVGFMPLAESIGLDKIISPRQVTASRILQYLRRGRIHALHTIRDGAAEFMEMEVSPASPLCGAMLSQIDLPFDAYISAVVKPSGRVVPGYQSHGQLEMGDRVIIFSAAATAASLDEFF